MHDLVTCSENALGETQTNVFAIVSRDDEEPMVLDGHQDEWDEVPEQGDDIPKGAQMAWQPLRLDEARVQVADVDEVEMLTGNESLLALRHFRSFDHEVRLSFHPADMMFYAMVFMDGLLWRALKSLDLQVAENAFDEFVVQASQRTRAQVRRMQLEARNAQLEQTIAESTVKAARLRANIERHAALKHRAMERENALRNDIKQLEASRVQAQLQADRNLRLIGQLHASSASGLPQPKRASSNLRFRQT